jgi:hypothetical protein
MEASLLQLLNVCGFNTFEFERTMGNLESCKSIGTDQIPADLVQSGDGTVHSELRNFINYVWNKEELPRKGKE